MALFEFIRNATAGVLHVLLPAACPACHGEIEDGRVLCVSCTNRIVPIREPACPHCGAESRRRNPRRCPNCPPETMHFASAHAALRYIEALPEIFYAFKYFNHPELADVFVPILWEALRLRRAMPEIDVLTPVPLHWRRRLWRGYNQSELIARGIAEHSGLPCETDLIIRVRHTPRQALLPHTDRARNVKGAFAVETPTRIAGRSIGLVDDMMTTGHTVNECARVLMNARARAVHVITLART
jgi:competence protein ComFC